MGKGLTPLSIVANPAVTGPLAVGLSMRQGERQSSPGNSDIFVRIPSIPSTPSGRDSAASKSGTVMNGENAFRITLIVLAPRVNGPPTISSAAAGGSGSFRCAGEMSVLV